MRLVGVWVRMFVVLAGVLGLRAVAWSEQALVLQPDFGTKDGAVAAMKGVAVEVRIWEGERIVFEARVPYHDTFGGVAEGEPLLYLNSLNNVALAINQGSFADRFGIRSGADWNIELSNGGASDEE